MSSPICMDCSTRLALILKYTALSTASFKLRPTTTQPWPRMSTELFAPMPRARSFPRQDVICRDEIALQCLDIAHASTPFARAASRLIQVQLLAAERATPLHRPLHDIGTMLAANGWIAGTRALFGAAVANGEAA